MNSLQIVFIFFINKRMYKINVKALSSKAEYGDSAQSNSINLSTSLQMSSQAFPQPKATSIEIPSISKKGLLAENSQMNKFNDSQVVALKKYYENENSNDPEEEAGVQIRVMKLAEDYVDLDWSKNNKSDSFDEFKIQIHCLNTNEHSEVRLPQHTTYHRLKKLRSGFSYSIRLCTVRKVNEVVCRSKYLIIQTSAPPDSPTLKLRFFRFSFIINSLF